MKNNQDPFIFNFYTMNNKSRSNYIKYHEPTKLYPSNSGRININLNSYKLNSNLNNNHNKHKKKSNNIFNINHNTNKTRQKYENVNLAKMLNNLKKEIVDISKNIKETDSKVDYYMNKNFENSKKMRNNSANISKNVIILPKKRESIINKGISLDSNNLNLNNNKILNFIYNDNKYGNKNLNKNINNSTRLTYNLYTNNNDKKLTIELNNDYFVNKLNKNKLYNNYIEEIKPKYHTAENFYHHNKRKKQNININKYINNKYNINEKNNENNFINNSNRISEKS